MQKELVINAQNDQISIALLEDKSLVELNKDTLQHSFVVGNIYLGRVKKLMPGLNAAFIDIGSDSSGDNSSSKTLPFLEACRVFSPVEPLP